MLKEHKIIIDLLKMTATYISTLAMCVNTAPILKEIKSKHCLVKLKEHSEIILIY